MRWPIVLANFYWCCGGIAMALSWQDAKDDAGGESGDDGSADGLTKVTARESQQLQLVQQNFLVGIASLAATHESNKTQCGRELEILLNAIEMRELWGLKVIDYFGAPPTSFTWGNFFWFNTPDLCDDLNQPLTISMARSQTPVMFNVSSPVAMHFLVVYLNFTTPFFIDLKLPFETLIHLGLCFPKSCDPQRIRFITNLYFQNENFAMQQMFQMQMEAVEVKTPHFSWQYFQQTATVLFLIVLSLSILLPIAAEIVYKSKQNLQFQHAMHNKTHHHDKLSPPPPPPPSAAAPPSAPAPQPPQPPSTAIVSDSLNNSMGEKLLLSFLIVENFKCSMSLDNTNRNSKFLTMMAGIRCIICLWITVFHVYYYSLFAMSNTPFIFAKLEKLALQPIMQACFYVDVFFVMSAFLVVNNFLSNTKQLRRIKASSFWECIRMFLRIALQRYMRLTPVMIVTMLLSTMTLDFLNMHSPFRLGEHSGFYCKVNWWYNLLYIHNFLDMNCICCSWTWYLACEMQYFILLTGLLFIHVKYPRIAKAVFLIFSVGLVIIAWISNFTNGITFQIDVIYGTLNELYVKPWVRIVPYLGGAIMGWCMYAFQTVLPKQQQQQQQQDPQPRQQQNHSTQQKRRRSLLPFSRPSKSKIFWLLSALLYVVTNFMTFWRSTPTWAVATVMSLGKLCFSLWIGGVIVMCARGYGGLLNSLLSNRVFLFLNKFCFSIYMLAPVIVIAMFGLRNEPTNFTEVGSGADFIAICALSIMSAFLLYLLIELPLQKISKVLLE